MWSAAACLLAKLGKKKTELLCHPAPPQHSSSSDRQNSIRHALHRNVSLPFSPSSSWHNYVPIFSSQGPVFSFIQDSSCEAQPWCFLKMVKCACFLLQSWQFQFSHSCLTKFLAAKENATRPGNFHRAVQGPSRGLSTCLYCNWSLSQVVWKCVENTSCSHSFYSFVIAKGELSLCQTHLNVFILLSIYVYSCILTSTFSERWGCQAKSLSIKIQCFMAKILRPCVNGNNS